MATPEEINCAFEEISTSYEPYSDLLILSGSHAYGMDHAGSDIDVRGIFVTPSEDLFKVNPPKTRVRY